MDSVYNSVGNHSGRVYIGGNTYPETWGQTALTVIIKGATLGDNKNGS
jgi:hypothetical protein